VRPCRRRPCGRAGTLRRVGAGRLGLGEPPVTHAGDGGARSLCYSFVPPLSTLSLSPCPSHLPRRPSLHPRAGSGAPGAERQGRRRRRGGAGNSRRPSLSSSRLLELEDEGRGGHGGSTRRSSSKPWRPGATTDPRRSSSQPWRPGGPPPPRPRAGAAQRPLVGWPGLQHRARQIMASKAALLLHLLPCPCLMAVREGRRRPSSASSFAETWLRQTGLELHTDSPTRLPPRISSAAAA
jgi:hypothetical protein